MTPPPRFLCTPHIGRILPDHVQMGNLYQQLFNLNLNNIAKKPASRLPGFRYVGPKIHKTDKVVLLGDAIHTVKPYFGLGANSAFEDVTSLDKCLDSHDNGADALKAFSRERAPEAKAHTGVL